MDKQDVYQYSGHKFFSRSFTTVFSGSNFWYFLLACVIALIPIIGPFWTLGYFVRRGQKIAWGIRRESTSEDLSFTPCLKTGLMTFVLYFFTSIFLVLLGYLFRINNFTWTIWSIIGPIVGIVFVSIADIYALHYAIYNNVNAILSKRPFTEIKQEGNSFTNMNIAVFFISLIFSALNAYIFSFLLIKLGFDTVYFLDVLQNQDQLTALAKYIVVNFDTFMVFFFFLMCSGLAVTALHINAVGLWLMGTNVAEWKAYNDPELPRQLEEGERPHLNTSKEEVIVEGEMKDNDITSSEDEVVDTIESPGAEIQVIQKENPVEETIKDSDDTSEVK